MTLRSALGILVAGTALGTMAYAGTHSGELAHTSACADMTLNVCGELDTSVVEDRRGESIPVGDLSEIVGVAVDDGAPPDLVACWIASGAYGDPTDGAEVLYASRLIIDSCNPLGWVES